MELGCALLNSSGEILHECGLGCGSCGICEAIGIERPQCHELYDYGVSERSCFGYKHFSFCPVGLCHLYSPVMRTDGEVVNIVAGPFLMADLEDFIANDLRQKRSLTGADLAQAVKLLVRIPNITPGKANDLSNMLSLMAGSIRGSLATAAPFEADAQADDVIQSQFSEYIFKRKEVRHLPEYPVKTEKRLLASIADSDKPKAQKLLNQLLGHILFSSGGDFDRMKSETYELLVLISRGAIDVGVSASRALGINNKFWREAQSVSDIYELCMLLSEVMNDYIDCIFSLSHKKNIGDINKAVQYIWQNYSNKITLEDAAKAVYLSPTYFCKVFQKRMGCSFNMYVNRLRIEKSKQLLLQYDLRIADIVSMVGFEDQSYFTKVFKRIAGVSPTHFRRAIEESVVSARYANVV
jgi:AraC-like DNA-binding protein